MMIDPLAPAARDREPSALKPPLLPFSVAIRSSTRAPLAILVTLSVSVLVSPTWTMPKFSVVAPSWACAVC